MVCARVGRALRQRPGYPLGRFRRLYKQAVVAHECDDLPIQVNAVLTEHFLEGERSIQLRLFYDIGNEVFVSSHA
jgi:hypothetical protein